MQLLDDLKNSRDSRLITMLFLATLIFVAAWFSVSLRPVSGGTDKVLFTVSKGMGFRDVADSLVSQKLARSPLALKAYLVFTGAAFHLQSGVYLLSPNESAQEIAGILRSGARQEIKAVIPEGSSIYDIDAILSQNYILKKGELISFAKATTTQIEGYLFPDTYNFFLNSDPADVIRTMEANFALKAEPLLAKDKKNSAKNLILASILEKEVPLFKDQQIVAGILLKRLSVGMALQVDASICYIKKQMGGDSCYPLSPLDFKLDSPYNTYQYKGLPPRPIGNPGVQSIEAALSPTATNYWFYLSDPATKKTIFSETLDNHAGNRVKYLDK